MSTMGRPSSYFPDLCELAHNYCLLGRPTTSWPNSSASRPHHQQLDRRPPRFEAAVKAGRVITDARVARRLYIRAVGYDRKVEREVVLGGELRPSPASSIIPPTSRPASSGCATVAAGLGARGRMIPTPIDDLALLDAAGESVRHHDGD